MWKLFLLNMYKGMKKWMMTALLLMLITTVQAGTKGNDKMSADIRQLAAQHAAGHRAAGTGGGDRICAFVRFGGDAQELLEKYDCQQLTQIGDIYIARIPVAQLSAMAATTSGATRCNAAVTSTTTSRSAWRRIHRIPTSATCC